LAIEGSETLPESFGQLKKPVMSVLAILAWHAMPWEPQALVKVVIIDIKESTSVYRK